MHSQYEPNRVSGVIDDHRPNGISVSATIARITRRIALLACGLISLASPSLAQNCPPAHLIAPNGAYGDRAGVSVAISGDTVLVGADDYAGSGPGYATVFRRSDTGWTFEATLFASDGAQHDLFAWPVAIDGDTAIAGAHWADVGGNPDQGAAYIFVRTGNVWSQQAKLTVPDGASSDNFGVCVAISGDTAIVGARGDDIGSHPDQGSAYIFVRSGTTWTQQANLIAAAGLAGDQFGFAVSVSGDTAVVGALSADIGANANQGAAYVFTRSGTDWTQQAVLSASDGAPDSYFGYSVSISGESAMVGAFHDTVGANPSQGSAYVYVRSGTTWTEQAQLISSDGAPNDQFGTSVAIDGDTALVAAHLHNGERGAAYVYTRAGAAWTEQAQLTAPDGAPGDRLGLSVALQGATAVAGVYQDSIGGNYLQGSAWVFPDPSDVDGDGLGDLCDPCPGDATNTCIQQGSAARTIPAAEGGTLRTPNGEVTLDVPAGAMDLDRTVSITQIVRVDPTADLFIAGGAGRGTAIAVYNFEPEGTTFSPTANLRFVLDVRHLNTKQRDNLNVYMDVDGVFIPVPGATVQVTQSPPYIATIDVPLSHFSDYAVIAPLDSDGDRLFDLFPPEDEATFGTDPFNPDTDNDNLLDGDEVDMAHGTGCPNPAMFDSDADTLGDGAEVAAGTDPCNIDTDGDMIPDNLDPLPLDVGGTADFIASELLSLSTLVAGLEPGHFSAPNTIASQNRQATLATRLRNAANQVRSSRYADARRTLESLMLVVDGQSPPPDWMIPSPERNELYQQLTYLTQLLAYLL